MIIYLLVVVGVRWLCGRMASPSSGPAKLDCSMARLFSQLVSLQLAQIMQASDQSFYDETPGWPYDANSTALGLLEQRLNGLEKTQAEMMALLQNVVNRLPPSVMVGVPVPVFPAEPDTSQYFSAPFVAVDPHISANVAPTSAQLCPKFNTSVNMVPSSAPQFAAIAHTFANMAPSARDVVGISSGSGGSSGDHSSPDGFLFVCSLCLRPQHTPKTHCEHMRRMAEGVGTCSLSQPPQLMPDRHKRILAVFDTASRFVTWCVLLVSACALY